MLCCAVPLYSLSVDSSVTVVVILIAIVRVIRVSTASCWTHFTFCIISFLSVLFYTCVDLFYFGLIFNFCFFTLLENEN